MKTTIFKLKPLSTKTKIIVSKEIIINLKLILLSLIITFIAFIFFYFTLKPNKQEIQNKIKIENNKNKPNKSIKNIYDFYISKGVKMPDYKIFENELLSSNETLKNTYNSMGELGVKMPDYSVFENDVRGQNINIIYKQRLTIFKEEIKDKTLFTFILSLFGLILGRYFYKLTNIALKQLVLLVKAIKKYSKMDVN